jgi:hypothetical protein
MDYGLFSEGNPFLAFLGFGQICLLLEEIAASVGQTSFYITQINV